MNSKNFQSTIDHTFQNLSNVTNLMHQIKNEFVILGSCKSKGIFNNINMAYGIIGLSRDGSLVCYDEQQSKWLLDSKKSIILHNITIHTIKGNLNEQGRLNYTYQIVIDGKRENKLLAYYKTLKNYEENCQITLEFEENDQFRQWVCNLSPFVVSQKIQSQYEVIQEIGKGHFSQVFSAGVLYDSPYFRIHKQVAIKRIRKLNQSTLDQDFQLIINEINCMQELSLSMEVFNLSMLFRIRYCFLLRIKLLISGKQSHDVMFFANSQSDQILKILQIFESEKRIYIIMEYIQGGDLHLQYKNTDYITEQDKRILAEAILKGLETIHSKGIIHRDLKLKNILIEKPGDYSTLKIADFGLAVNESDKTWERTLLCGTPGFIAPEILTGQGYGTINDIFSFGCILYQFIKKKQLFKGKSPRECLQNVIQFKAERLENDPLLNEHDRQFLKLLLNEDPNKRLTATEALKHEWFGILNKKSTDQTNFEDSFIDKLPLNPLKLENKKSHKYDKKVSEQIEHVEILIEPASNENIPGYAMNHAQSHAYLSCSGNSSELAEPFILQRNQYLDFNLKDKPENQMIQQSQGDSEECFEDEEGIESINEYQCLQNSIRKIFVQESTLNLIDNIANLQISQITEN